MSNIVLWLFIAVPLDSLQCVIVVFLSYSHFYTMFGPF